VNDIDMQGVDLSTIPRDSIQRIESPKATAALCSTATMPWAASSTSSPRPGDGPAAVRTRRGRRRVFRPAPGRSVGFREFGPWSTSFYGKQINSDGYRVNNKLAQHDAIGDIRYTTPDLTAYLTLSGDEQALGFPGGRLVDPSIGVNQLVTDRKGAATPFDHAEKQVPTPPPDSSSRWGTGRTDRRRRRA